MRTTRSCAGRIAVLPHVREQKRLHRAAHAHDTVRGRTNP
ncbi:hypothetical protein N136_01566 [Leifsonia aquatica ATCC 14665]|uniref:Uncharacterized protein n=1 Tax=Leifsonia aquatica ATCC 14665 TaxID=1358026 RepID=U2RA04_LEIAQ|nr:hypothetical protein N136_01566 [Leifsonia aquatica ATCC 14665]